MQTLPPKPRRKVVKPQRPTGPKKLAPTLITSGLCILIVMYALGQFPQVNACFTNLNEIIQSHNDAIVHTIIRLFPALLLAFGALGLSSMLVGTLRNRRKSA